MPTRIGKYEIESVLSEGGMGTVYLARDSLLNRKVAVKVLAAELCDDPVLVRRFEEEAKALAKIQHPNVMSIYAVGREGPRLYYAMEYVPGRTLAEVVEKGGPLGLAEAARVFNRLAAALARINQAGIVHRDVKPGNVMIGERGRVVLMDFGLAKSADRSQLTAAGAILGTPEYMAPEQALGETVDARADVYALGAVLFEMLCGRPPFQGPDSFSIIRRHIEEPPPSARAERPDLPEAFDRLLGKAMAKDPARRFATAEGMAREVAALWPKAGETLPTAARTTRAPLAADAPTREAPPHPEERPEISPAPARAGATPPRHRRRDPVAAGLLVFGALAGLVGLALISIWWLAEPSVPAQEGALVRVTLAGGRTFAARWISTERRQERSDFVVYGNFLMRNGRINTLRLERPTEVRAIDVIDGTSEEGAGR